MSLYKRNSVWWIRFTAPDGQRVQRSAQTSDKVSAQEFHDQLKADLWRAVKLKEKPARHWQEAAVRWLKETAHKATHEDDKWHLRLLDPYLGNLTLTQIDRDCIDHFVTQRLRQDVANASVNRTLAVMRAILRRAEREWEWLDKAPYIRMLKEPKRRIRWLRPEEARRLLFELPDHSEVIARFSLATGLRKSNVLGLKWKQVDLVRKCAHVEADEAKAGHSIYVPLSDEAISVLKGQIGKHSEYVFIYRGNPIKEVNTKSWRNALRRAEIENFRWHDLRHTWASWHVQQGTPLAVLQELGAWESAEMVRRYAHFGNEHLNQFAQLLIGPKLEEGRCYNSGTVELKVAA